MTAHYQNSYHIISEDIARICSAALPWHKLNGSTILISGASGFLASYIVEALALLNKSGANIEIVGLVRNMQKSVDRLGHLQEYGLKLFLQDLSKPLTYDFQRLDYVIHAASQASPKYYGIDPVGTIAANTLGTNELLNLSVKKNTRAFLYFSSGEVYGAPLNQINAISEMDFGYLDPASVRACYAESKRVGETMCVAWNQQYGLNTKIIRPFHTYGPGMSLDDGRVFADFVANVISNSDIQMKSDGAATRPLCYISDAIAGMFTVLFKGKEAEAYNISNPAEVISIIDLANLVSKLHPDRQVSVKRTLRDKNDAYLPSPVINLVPSIKKIEQLGWHPKTSVSEGFLRTISYYIEYGKNNG